jgi:hypothetical protein
MARSVPQIRGQIEKLKAEREPLARVTCNQPEARAAIEAWAAARVADGEARFRRSVERIGRTGQVDGRPFIVEPDRPTDLAPLLAAVVGGPALAAALIAHLESVHDGLDTEGRARRIAEIDRALDAAEREEERLICESESTGTPIRRRADCRPEIVLGVPQ